MVKHKYTIPYKCPYCGGDGKGNHLQNCSNDPYKVKKADTKVPTDEEITEAINQR